MTEDDSVYATVSCYCYLIISAVVHQYQFKRANRPVTYFERALPAPGAVLQRIFGPSGNSSGYFSRISLNVMPSHLPKWRSLRSGIITGVSPNGPANNSALFSALESGDA